MDETVATIRLKQGEDRRIRAGHLWVFSNEIEQTEGDVAPGDEVRVEDARGHLLGVGYINPNSLISVRLMSRGKDEITREFIERRLLRAWEYRQKIWPGETVCRVVHGEADLLPGLVVDRYGDCVVVQSLTVGIERRLEAVLDALEVVLAPSTIVLRNDSPMRSYEGLPLEKRVVKGDFDRPLVIEQDGLKFIVDALEGQKTGFFLDQRENRSATAPLARDVDVLDCCCHTGAWSVAAAAAGARSVLGIDSSARALELAGEAAGLNGVSDAVEFTQGDLFKSLAALGRSKRRFGLVVLDPPAFAKSRKKIREALKAYRTANRMAMALTETGGHLVTCSCSHLVEREAFMNALVGAGREAGRHARVVEVRGQSRDHPVILGLPETDYLKCVVMEML